MTSVPLTLETRPYEFPDPASDIDIFCIHRGEQQELEALRKLAGDALVDALLETQHAFFCGAIANGRAAFTSAPDLDSVEYFLSLACTRYADFEGVIRWHLMMPEDIRPGVIKRLQARTLAAVPAGGYA